MLSYFHVILSALQLATFQSSRLTGSTVAW